MPTRKELKSAARGTVRKHYFLLVILCAISIFLGTEFNNVASNAEDLYRGITGQQIVRNDNLLMGGERGQVLTDLLDDNLNAGKTQSTDTIEEYKENDTSSILGRRNGVLAGLVNNISSGHLYVQLVEAMLSVIHSAALATALLIILGVLIYAWIWVFLKNMYRSILRRAVLEMRTYDQMPMNHLLYFKLVKKWAKAAWTLLVTSILEALWDITIIGGIIKHYSYFMVPFIVAENPNMGTREAITLSRRMMYGHKWECFVMDLSFLGWRILGIITFGLVDVFWRLPYQMSTYGEYYASIRKAAKELPIENAEKLNDEYLFRRARQTTLNQSYKDVVAQESYIQGKQPVLSKVQLFFSKNFGIWIGSVQQKLAYEDVENRKFQIKSEESVMNGKAYPQRLSPLWTKDSSVFTRRVNYMNNYTIWSIILMFFIFAFVGWMWEVSLHLIKDGVFVNRGAMHGPWLPIYGGGVVMILILLRRFRENLPLEVLAIIILCGIVEFSTSYFMEKSTGLRWWDYSGYFLNLDGRICAEGLLVFAIGGTAAVYLAIPALDAMISRVKVRIIAPICILLLALFGADLVYSHYVPNEGEGITDYTEYLQEG